MRVANLIELPARVAKPRRSKRIPGAFLTPEETLAVLRAAKERGARDHAMILLAYRHGLRASEVCGLRLADVDLKDGAVTMQRLKGSMKTVQPLYAHRGQPLLDEVAALQSWLKIQQRPMAQITYSRPRRAAVWTARNSSGSSKRVAEAAGSPAEKSHSTCLKHSLASHLVAGNVNLALIKQLSGIAA